jgi:SAM-dependent methyltransferase
VSGAVRAWGQALQGWGIPEEILERAPESPWAYSTGSFRRRAEQAIRPDAPRTPTIARTLEALPPGGSLLDVGVGGGAASLPLASRASMIVGVDASEDMLAAFREAAGSIGVRVRTIAGRWPDVADSAPRADVAVCAHVLYNVQELEPFVGALEEHAAHRVVLELTETHPVAWMNDLWLHFHDLERPHRPTAEDAAAALRELGIDVLAERAVRRSRSGGFERREDAIAIVRRRLCLPSDRDEEIAAALGPRLAEHDGAWSSGPEEQTVVTLWWDTAGDRRDRPQQLRQDSRTTFADPNVPRS